MYEYETMVLMDEEETEVPVSGADVPLEEEVPEIEDEDEEIVPPTEDEEEL